MNLLIFGANGRLAKEFVKLATGEGFKVYAYTRQEVDITSPSKVESAFAKANPDIVLNFAGYTNVDGAETRIGSLDSTLCNVYGPRIIASLCEDYSAKLCHISTGFVFDGRLDFENSYDENSQPNPINKYGKTKLMSEKVIQDQIKEYFIIRTNWLFGSTNDFLSKAIEKGLAGQEVLAVDNQYGSFAYIKDLASFCLSIIKTKNYGVYNYVNKNCATPYDFIKYAFDLMQIKTKVTNTGFESFPFVAERQKNICLSLNKIIEAGVDIPTWQDSLKKFLEENYIEKFN